MFNAISETQTDDRRTILLYGAGGAGKTALCGALAQHPAFGDVLVVNVEDGLRTLRGLPGIYSSTIPRNTRELQNIYGALKTRDPKVVPESVQTLVIDSLSACETLARVRAANIAAESIDSPANLGLREWGVRTGIMLTVMREGCRLPFRNVIFTCLESQNETESGAISSIAPALSDKISTQAVGLVDHVLRLAVGPDGKRTITASRSSIVAAKSRTVGFEAKHGAKVAVPDVRSADGRKALADLIADL